jgi:hypothetical protein
MEKNEGMNTDALQNSILRQGQDLGISASGFGRARHLSPKLQSLFGRYGADICEMSDRNEAFRVSLLELSQERFHLIGLALALRDRSSTAGQFGLGELATELTTTRPRDLIARLYGRCPFGLVGCLKKLPRRIMSGSAYLRLIVLLEEPRAAKVLWHADRLTPNMITLLQRVDPALRRSKFVGWLAVPRAVEVVDYLIAAILRARPDVERQQLLSSLARVGSASSLETWCVRWLSKAALPDPPWPGIELLRPLRTVGELKATGRRFQNCLAAKIGSVLARRRYYYVWIGPPGAVCELVNDPLIGWSVGEINGCQNTQLASRLVKKVEATFASHGIRKRPDFMTLPDHVDITTWSRLHIEW